MKKNKKKKSKIDTSDWEGLYRSEEKKFKKYIEATQISSAVELTQELTPDPSIRQILIHY